MDVTVIYTRFTLAERIPELADQREHAAAEHEAALRRAADLAAALG
jgi:hypothetical protein